MVVHVLQGNYTSIPIIHFYMQRFNFIDFMVIELRFFKEEEEEEEEEEKKETWTKCGNNFSDIMYILHHNTTNFCILVIFNRYQLQMESENEQNPYIWFSMGMDHSNPSTV